MKKIITTVSLAILGFTAQAGEFVEIDYNDGLSVSFKRGTTRIFGDFYEVVASFHFKEADSTEIRLVRIPKSACENEYGYVYNYDLGGIFQHRTAFALNTGTIISTEAAYLCLWGKFIEPKPVKKSS